MNNLKKWFLVKVSEVLATKRHIYRFQSVRSVIENYIIGQFLKGDIQPKMIDLQFVDGCNYRCDFCFRRYDIHKPRLMPEKVFETSLSKIPKDFPHHISTYLVDESTLHPKWFEWTLRVADTFSKAEINLSTNATLITRDQYDGLTACPNVHLVVNTYGKQGIIDKVKGWPVNERVFISYHSEPFYIGNWGGVFNSLFTLPLKHGCMRPFRDFSIGWDGRVHGCGIDTTDSFVFGDITKQSIEEIWNNPEWVKLRENLLKRNRTGRCALCDDSGINIYGDYRRQEI